MGAYIKKWCNNALCIAINHVAGLSMQSANYDLHKGFEIPGKTETSSSLNVADSGNCQDKAVYGPTNNGNYNDTGTISN